VEAVEATRGEVTPDGGAAIFARDSEGRATLRYEAKRVIVADGRRSFLARQLGFIEPENLNRERRRFAVRAHCEGVTGLSDFAEMQVGRGGYCGIAPLSATRANVCYVLFTDRLDITPSTIEQDFRRHLEGFPGVSHRLGHARTEGIIRVAGPLRLRSKRQASGPFLACGDTTGFLDPFTGEGIAHAIATGIRAAAAVRESLHGRKGALREYQQDVRSLRRIKGASALFLYGLVSRHALADAAAVVFARVPRLGDAVVRLFGDQV
jgi:flavin-dependent dehydrogenase